jgi:hypothetical protein
MLLLLLLPLSSAAGLPHINLAQIHLEAHQPQEALQEYVQALALLLMHSNSAESEKVSSTTTNTVCIGGSISVGATVLRAVCANVIACRACDRAFCM